MNLQPTRSISEMMNERPLVSVVLLSYNRPRLLRDALDSVCSQSYENVEVIVVDNKSGASDEIAEIVCGREGVGSLPGPGRGTLAASRDP